MKGWNFNTLTELSRLLLLLFEPSESIDPVEAELRQFTSNMHMLYNECMFNVDAPTLDAYRVTKQR